MQSESDNIFCIDPSAFAASAEALSRSNSNRRKATHETRDSMFDDVSEQSANEIAKNALMKGLAKGSIGAVNKRAVDLFLTQLGDKCPDVLKTEAGRRGLEVAFPYMMLQLLEIQQIGDRVPKKDAVRSGLQMAMEDAAQRATGQGIDAMISLIMPMFNEFAQVAGELPDLEAGSLDAALEKSSVKERERIQVG